MEIDPKLKKFHEAVIGSVYDFNDTKVRSWLRLSKQCMDYILVKAMTDPPGAKKFANEFAALCSEAIRASQGHPLTTTLTLHLRFRQHVAQEFIRGGREAMKAAIDGKPSTLAI